MNENVVLCAVCTWRSVCDKKYSISGVEIFDCFDFTRDITLSISGFEDILSLISDNKNYKVN